MNDIAQNLFNYWVFIKSVGVTPSMEEFEKRKMGIFNQLNLFGVMSGLAMLVAGLFNKEHLPALAWFVAGFPLAISVFVLWLNYEQYYTLSKLIYFSLYPIATCLVYMGNVDVGIELFFILYGVLSVFFFQQVITILFCFSLSLVCYFLSSVMVHDFYFRLASVNYAFYVFNHLLAGGFIFYALYLIKQENYGYQMNLLKKGRELHRRNLEVEQQRHEITEKARLLEKQTGELTELNQVKNKLFSVIAHDLKTPMYALRNLFHTMQHHKISAKEIKELLPGITSDMNYTTSLMENLLQWARSQMKSASVHPEVLDIQNMIAEVLRLQQLQASNKQIYLETRIEQPMYCYADRDMVNLVLRNLLSNAIKFTPERGKIMVGANENNSFIEIFIQDTGIGMSEEAIQQLFGNGYFTTRGTDNETGTGLGLKLCRDFLEKNGGNISVESEPGKGSIFSFTLPRYAEAV